MSNTTLARPYAKAIFEHALASNELDAWSSILMDLTSLVLDEAAQQFISNPQTTAAIRAAFISSVLSGKLKQPFVDNVGRFVLMLSERGRLGLLPEMLSLYELLKSEHKKHMVVFVRSFSPLTKEQQHKLADSLSKKLKKQVSLEISIDESLLGGAIIEAGDLVFDGSVRGKLNELGSSLAA